MELVDRKLVEGAVCEEVKLEDVPELIKLGEQMIKLSVTSGGVGLSASQVGVNKKMFVWQIKEFSTTQSYQIVFNPRFYKDGKQVKMLEGCLTYGDDHYLVDRWKGIRAVFDTFNGEKLVKITEHLTGVKAVIFQHETDHTNGETIATKGEKLSNDKNKEFNETIRRKETIRKGVARHTDVPSGEKSDKDVKSLGGSASTSFEPNQ
jgi:peptide deformylase